MGKRCVSWILISASGTWMLCWDSTIGLCMTSSMLPTAGLNWAKLLLKISVLMTCFTCFQLPKIPINSFKWRSGPRNCWWFKTWLWFILIDCPAGIEQGFMNAIAGADSAIIVTTPEISAVRDADRVVGLLEQHPLQEQPHWLSTEFVNIWWRTVQLWMSMKLPTILALNY